MWSRRVDGKRTEVASYRKTHRGGKGLINLDDQARTIEGSITLGEIGLDPARAYFFDEPWARCADGKLVVKAAQGVNPPFLFYMDFLYNQTDTA